MLALGASAAVGETHTTMIVPISTYFKTTTATTHYGSSPYTGKLPGMSSVYTYANGILYALCSVVNDGFIVTKGTSVSFSMTSDNNPIIFSIMTPAQFASLDTKHNEYAGPNFAVCGSQAGNLGAPSYKGPWPALDVHFFFTSYSATWTAPSDGQYYWVLSTGGSRKTAQYSLSIWSVGSQAATYTMMQTQTSQILQESISSQLSTSPSAGLPPTELGIILAVMAVLVLVGVAGYQLSKRKKNR